MTIWRDMLIEQDVDTPTLTQGFADALGVDAARVAVVADTHEGWPAWVEGFEVVAETRPLRGEARLMATLFLFRGPAEVERVDDHAVARTLADALGCTVLLPDEADTDPSVFLRFRPKVATDRVYLDPDGLDERPPRVAVSEPVLSDADGGASHIAT